MPDYRDRPSTFPLPGADGAPIDATVDAYEDAPLGAARAEMSVAVVRMAPGQTLQTHYHLRTRETFVVTSGQCTATVDGRAYALSRGARLVVEPGERHGFSTPPDSDVEMVAVSLPAHDPDDFIPA